MGVEWQGHIEKSSVDGRLYCGSSLENKLCYIDLYLIHGISSVEPHKIEIP